MVATLMKYEFLRTRRWLGIMAVFGTVLTVVGALLAWTGWPLVSALGVMASVVAVGAFLTVVQLGLTFDYWRSSYSKTGYFTQTLPVKGTTIYWCKLLWGCIVTIVATAWNLALALIAYLGIAAVMEVAHPLTELREAAAGAVADMSPLLITGIAVAIMLSLFGGLAQYYFAASIGSEARINRLGIGGPILVLLGVYLALQGLLFVGIIAVPLGLEVTGAGASFVSMNFLQAVTSGEPAGAIPLGFAPVLIVVTAALVWRTVISWRRKVSLA